MTRADLIAHESFIAAAYRREAGRRPKNPALALALRSWADASDRRIEAMRAGPLFADLAEDAPESRAISTPSNGTEKSYVAPSKPLRLHAPNDAGEPIADDSDVAIPPFLRRLAGAA